MRKSFMVKVVRAGEPQLSMRVDTPQLARRYWRDVITRQPWFDDLKEHIIVLLLSTRYAVEDYYLVSIGSLNESIAHPREIFRAAIASGSFAIIVMHNHPSGDPSPSNSDSHLTKRIRDAAEILQINLLDHVIIGRRHRAVPASRLRGRAARAWADSMRCGYFSFKEAGEL